MAVMARPIPKPKSSPLSRYKMDETTDVGCETGTTVAEDYDARASKFNGLINWIQLEKGLNDCDHLITPEQRLKVAMTRQ